MPTLVSVTSRNIVTLDDATVWLVGPSHLDVVGTWIADDPIAVGEDRRLTYFIELTNKRTGERAHVLPARWL